MVCLMPSSSTARREARSRFSTERQHHTNTNTMSDSSAHALPGTAFSSNFVRLFVDSEGAVFMVFGRPTGKTSDLNSIFRNTSCTSYRCHKDTDHSYPPSLSSSVLFGAPVLSCAVKSNQGQHCPEPPSRVVRIDGGDEIMLCPRCYENACAGGYGVMSVITVREIHSPNDKGDSQNSYQKS